MDKTSKIQTPLDTVSDYGKSTIQTYIKILQLEHMKPLELRGQEEEKDRQFQDEMRRG